MNSFDVFVIKGFTVVDINIPNKKNHLRKQYQNRHSIHMFIYRHLVGVRRDNLTDIYTLKV